jgi:ribose transport system ATP-binding protein
MRSSYRKGGDAMTNRAFAIQVLDAQKSYGGIPVLGGVSFNIPAGHIVALAGENGAGKSTLMKIISGQVKADAGDVFVFGEKLIQGDPRISRRAGISIVPQELAPYADLTVYENLFVGREIRNRLGLLNRNEMAKQATSMLEVFGVEIDPKVKMNRLSVALTQIVEIAKATSWGARILLLDEPTSAIPEREVAQLYKVVDALKKQGVAMIYTTHRMSEIQRLADSVVVLRDGELALDVPIKEASEETIIRAMVGRDLQKLTSIKSQAKAQEKLQIKNLVIDKKTPAISFNVHAGEILGLGGLIGAGRTEIVEAIFGIRHSRSGEILLNGKLIKRNNPAQSIKAGMALVPEDRKGAGLVLSRSVLENTSLPHLSKFGSFGWVNFEARKVAVSKVSKSVNLKSRGSTQLTGTLSGGNQQKVVLSRWLTQDVNLLILDEPTRGVDVGARGEIYSIIRDLAATGMAVLLVSSDMPELIGLSDRVLVLRGGAVMGELDRKSLNQEDAQIEIFKLASGQSKVVKSA